MLINQPVTVEPVYIQTSDWPDYMTDIISSEIYIYISEPLQCSASGDVEACKKRFR